MTTYDVDRYAWSIEQGRHLHAADPKNLDTANIAREIERLGEDDIRVLRERLVILLKSLLRWAYEVDLRSVALDCTIFTQRVQIRSLLDDSPSLVPVVDEMVIDVYPEARHLAAIESGPFEDAFPAGLPFLPSEVLDDGFLPDPYGDEVIRGPGWWRHR